MSIATDLVRSRYLALATFRGSGAEVRTPVWFAVVDERLYVFTAGDSGKVKRLRRSSRARVAPCDARGRVGDARTWRDATARLLTTPPPAVECALASKYGWQKRVLDLFSRLSGRMQRRMWIEIALDA